MANYKDIRMFIFVNIMMKITFSKFVKFRELFFNSIEVWENVDELSLL